MVQGSCFLSHLSPSDGLSAVLGDAHLYDLRLSMHKTSAHALAYIHILFYSNIFGNRYCLNGNRENMTVTTDNEWKVQAVTSLRSVTACLWRHSTDSSSSKVSAAVYSFCHAATAAAVTSQKCDVTHIVVQRYRRPELFCKIRCFTTSAGLLTILFESIGNTNTNTCFKKYCRYQYQYFLNNTFFITYTYTYVSPVYFLLQHIKSKHSIFNLNHSGETTLHPNETSVSAAAIHSLTERMNNIISNCSLLSWGRRGE